MFCLIVVCIASVAANELLLGVGYNLLRGYPQLSSLDTDHGLLSNRQILAVTKTNGETKSSHKKTHHCSPSTSTWQLSDRDSFRRYLLSTVLSSGHDKDGLASAAFSLNSDFVKAVDEIEATDETANREVVSCTIKSYDLQDYDSVTVSREFASAVCDLPTTYDLTTYRTFIENWGTDVVVGTEIGTIKQGSTETRGNSKIVKPILVRIHLVPVSEALNFWMLDEVIQKGTCSSLTNMELVKKIASNIELALKHYPSTAAQPLKSIESRQSMSEVQWPSGTYGIMKPAQGCPVGGVNWSGGWLYQDTEDHHPSSSFTTEIAHFLAGEFHSSHITTEFCIKTNAHEGTVDWQSGNYCILRYGGTCPKGFHDGALYWDDEDDDNHNHHSGVLPDGTYNRNTRIDYCCRHDGTGTDISLPTAHPFVLVRYGSRCQNVEGMDFRDIFIHWDDEDDNNENEWYGDHPYDENHRNHVVHYCYYESHGGGSGTIVVG